MARSQSRNDGWRSSRSATSVPISGQQARSKTEFNKQRPSSGDMVSMQVSAVEMQEMKEAFDFFDENNDGKITRMELEMALRRLGDNPTEREVTEMVKEVDSDGDGVISFEEFMSLQPFVSGIHQQVAGDDKLFDEDMREAFLRFDTNKDGLISPRELQDVMERLGHSCTLDECCRMISCVDYDGDGHVSFEEFQLMMA